MARLGFYFQSVSIAVVFLAALACASGEDSVTGDGGSAATKAGSGGAGQSGSSGQTATGGASTTTGGGAPTSGNGEPPNTVEPFCGDNLVNVDTEICDGTDLAGVTCADLITDNIGDLACEADCSNYNTTMCYPDPNKAPDEAGSGDTAGYGG